MAPPTLPPEGAFLHPFWEMYGFGIAAVVFISMAFILGIGYIIAALFNSDKLRTWCKEEFYHLIVSVLVFTFLLSFIVLMNGFLQTIILEQRLNYAGNVELFSCGLLDHCHMKLAYHHTAALFDRVREFIVSLLIANVWIGFISSFNIGVGFPGIELSRAVSPFAGLSVQMSAISQVVGHLIKFLIFLKLQEVSFLVIANPVFPILLTTGIILRTFFLTRRIGGLLIALMLGLYYVFPSMYVLSDFLWERYLYMTPTRSDYLIVATNLPSSFGPVSSNPGNPTRAALDFTDNALKNTGDTPPSAVTVINDNYNAFQRLGYSWIIDDEGVLEHTARLTIFITFFPIFSLLSVIAFVKTFSPILGGDIEIAGLSRLI